MAIVLKTVSDSQKAREDLAKLRDSVESIKSSTESVSRNFSNLSKVIASTAAAAYSFKAITQLSDEITNLENRIRVVTASQQEFNAALGSIRNIALSTRSEMSAVAKLYTKVALSTKELGANQKQLYSFTQSVAKSMALSGASAEETKNSLTQLGQALASGKLAGDEFRSVMENAPILAQQIAKGLGVTLGQMYELRDAGKLTSKSVFEAILKQTDEINKGAGNLKITYAAAFTNLRTSGIMLADAIKKTFLGTSDGFARMINNFALGVANFASNFRLNLLLVKSNIIIFIFNVQNLFTYLWERMREGPQSVYLAFKEWISKISPLLVGASGSAQAFAVKATKSLIAGFSLLKEIIRTSFVKDAFNYVVRMFDNVGILLAEAFKKIKKIDVAAFFPNLSKSLDTVKRWANSVERWFWWLYDKVIGRSWIPDLVKSVGFWLSKLNLEPLDTIKKFVAVSSSLFSRIKFVFPTAAIIGAVSRVTGTLLKLFAIVSAIGAVWAGYGIASGKLDIKVLEGTIVAKFLRNIYNKLNELVQKFKGNVTEKVDAQKQKARNAFGTVVDRVNQTVFMRDLKQALGIKDTYKGNVRGEAINTSGFVGRGILSNFEKRTPFHDIMALFPPNVQAAFLTALTGIFATAIIAATSSGGVRAALLSMLGGGFVFTILNNMKISSLIEMFRKPLDLLGADVDNLKTRADKLLKKNSDGKGPKVGVERMVGILPDPLKTPVLTGITAIFAAGIIGATSSGPVRSALLSLLTSVFGIVLAKYVPSSVITESVSGLASKIATGVSGGLFLALGNKTVIEKPLDFLSLAAKTSLLTSAGRNYFGGMALGAVTAPNSLVNNSSDKFLLRRQENIIKKSSDLINNTSKLVATDQNQLAIAVRDLSKTSGISLERAKAISEGARDSLARTPQGIAAVRAFNQLDTSKKLLNTQEGDSARIEAIRKRDNLKSTITQRSDAMMAGVRNVASGAGGLIGTAFGLQVGSAIALSMEGAPSWQKIGVQIATALGGQLIGSLAGQAFVGTIVGLGSLFGTVAGFFWKLAVDSSLGVWTKAKYTAFKTFVSQTAHLARVLVVGALRIGGAMIASAVKSVLVLVGGLLSSGPVLVALLIAGVAALIYHFRKDLSDPSFWKALGVTVGNIFVKLFSLVLKGIFGLIQPLLYLIGGSAAAAATIDYENMKIKGEDVSDYVKRTRPEKPSDKSSVKNPKEKAEEKGFFDKLKDTFKPFVEGVKSFDIGKTFDATKEKLGLKGDGFTDVLKNILESIKGKLPEVKEGETVDVQAPEYLAATSTAIEQKGFLELLGLLNGAKDRASFLASSAGIAGFKASPEDFLDKITGAFKPTTDFLKQLADPLDQIAQLQKVVAAQPNTTLGQQARETIANLRKELETKFDVGALLGDINDPLKQVGEDKEDKAAKYKGLKAGERFDVVNEIFPNLMLTLERFEALSGSVADALVLKALPVKNLRDVLRDRPISDPQATQNAFQTIERKRVAEETAATEILEGSITTFEKYTRFLSQIGDSNLNTRTFNFITPTQIKDLETNARLFEEAQKGLSTVLGKTPEELVQRQVWERTIDNVKEKLAEIGSNLADAADRDFLGPIKRLLSRANLNASDQELYSMSNEESAALSKRATYAASQQERLKDPSTTPRERFGILREMDMLSDQLADELARLPINRLRKIKEAGLALASSIQNSLTESLTSFFTGKGFNISDVLDRISTAIISTMVNGLLDPLTGENGILASFFRRMGSNIYGVSQDATYSALGQSSGFSNVANGILSINSSLPSMSTLPGMLSSYGGDTWDIATSPLNGTAVPDLSGGLNDILPQTNQVFSKLGEDIIEGSSLMQDASGGIMEGASKLASGLSGKGGGSLMNSAVGFGAGLLGMLIGSFFADGGLVRGPGTGTSDSIVAAISNGEYVVNAKATAKNLPLLQAINSGKLPRFAEGGLVSTDLIKAAPTTAVDLSDLGERKDTKIINLSITGDISRQTRAQVLEMLPLIAAGVNQQNYEKGYRS
jgi:tape measure domain-containing protein